MTTASSLLDRARSGLLSRGEVDAMARVVAAGTSRDRYTAIHVLGLMRATEHEELVATFLDCSNDPMLSRIALQVLTAHWGLSQKYRDRIRQFCRGVPWDTDGDVRLAALTAAGELARETGDREIVALLLGILDGESEPDVVRQSAYFALARAAGRDWSELPLASRKLKLDSELDAEVLGWANRSLLR